MDVGIIAKVIAIEILESFPLLQLLGASSDIKRSPYEDYDQG
jgi:hypothetical protein